MVVLSVSTVSFASSYAPSANIPSVSVQNVAKAIRMTGATLAVSVAVKQLLKGVEFVMDPENNQARSKEKVNYCAHGGSPCVHSPEEAVKYAMQSDFAVHWKYPFKGCKLDPRQGNGTINCTFEKDGDTRTVAFFNFGNPPLAVSYEQVAEQIIVNAKNGDKQAIAYLQSVANQNNPKPTTPVKPTQPKPPVTTQPTLSVPANPPATSTPTRPANPPAQREPEQPKRCNPCQPYPVGTIGYQGPKTSVHGIDGTRNGTGRLHYIIFQVQQNPKTCQCRWQETKKLFGHHYYGTPQSGWINLNGKSRPPSYP